MLTALCHLPARGSSGSLLRKGEVSILSGASRRGLLVQLPERRMLRERWDWGLGPDFLPLGPELPPLITEPFPVLRLMGH